MSAISRRAAGLAADFTTISKMFPNGPTHAASARADTESAPYGWGCADAVGADSISARGHIKRLPFEGNSRRQAGEGWLL